MLRIKAGLPFVMQDNLETTLHIAVLKKIKQKKVFSYFCTVPQITRRMVKTDAKCLPIVGETVGSTRPTAVC
jgi:hypothetical protein